MKHVESKLPKARTSIFSVMSALAEQHGAVNLSQGFPDFDPPDALLARVAHHLAGGRNQYAPTAGVLALREAIAAKLAACYAVDVDPEAAVTVTSGATEALFCAIQAVVRPGDEVVVFDPAYDAYEPAVSLAGGRTVHLPLCAPGFEVDWDRLAGAIGPRTRLVVINSPHNPTGTVLSRADLDRLCELTSASGCYVLSDEVYEHMVFDGREHASVLAHPALAERSFAVFSFGKTYHATGWKVGYCVAPPALTRELRRVHQYVTFAAVTPIQHALADYLRDAPDHHDGLAAFYGGRRDFFANLLRDCALRLEPAQGTYFQLADYGAISDLPDVEFARWLTVEHGVAAIPISVFYEDPPPARRVRLCFAKRDDTLEEAARRLRAL